MSSAPVKIALLEQKEVSSKPHQTAENAELKKRTLTYKGIFRGRQEFENHLRCSIQKLLEESYKQLPKLIIISAHGISHTGTSMDAGKAESIDWYTLKSYFKILPENLVIYLNSCFAMYATAREMQRETQGQNIPCVVGPLVNIRSDIANKFQDQLVQHLEENQGLDDDKMQRLIDDYNSDGGYRTDYGNDNVMAYLNRQRTIYPDTAANQFAAMSEGKATFQVVDLVSLERDDQKKPFVHYKVRNLENNIVYLLFAPHLCGEAYSPEMLLNKRFRVNYKIVDQPVIPGVGYSQIDERERFDEPTIRIIGKPEFR